jgi:hypothetical protein
MSNKHPEGFEYEKLNIIREIMIEFPTNNIPKGSNINNPRRNRGIRYAKNPSTRKGLN